MRPFNAILTVYTEDTTNVVIPLNLLDLQSKFQCPLCNVIGETADISLLSISDHLSRHYVENNREDIKKRIEEVKSPKITTDEILQYEKVVDPKYNFGGGGKDTFAPGYQTEEEELRLAIEESMRMVNSDTPTYQPRRKKVNE